MNYGQKCDISSCVAHEKNNFPCFPVTLPWQNYTLTTTGQKASAKDSYADSAARALPAQSW